ncbi:hypothetical protein ACFV06_12125 [Streptomyces sp. NPDC059618]|uniref:hypothetical protein n=1 Tax=Streptomyces sp. NPDC059618 TaxID=3346887 RepID=UPI0036BC1AD5
MTFRARTMIVWIIGVLYWHGSGFLHFPARPADSRVEPRSNFLLPLVVGVLIDQRL